MKIGDTNEFAFFEEHPSIGQELEAGEASLQFVEAPASKPVVQFSPAKINLFLAVTGVRADGFHNLVSLVTPVGFGDTLTLEVEKSGRDLLVCNNPNLPTNADNLVLKAKELFRKRNRFSDTVRFTLDKKIPVGAGLGGGSSNAVAALNALNAFRGYPLTRTALVKLAEQLGSDCPLFCEEKPLVMRGRGEQLSPISAATAQALKSWKVLIFKPSFSVDTAWAYNQLKKNPQFYVDAALAESQLNDCLLSLKSETFRSVNTFESIVFEKFRVLDVIKNQLQSELGLELHLSGSGSACFCLSKEEGLIETARKIIFQALGESIFCVTLAL